MSSRKLVLKSLEFDAPAGIPRQLWILPWATEKYPDELAEIRRRFPDDIVGAPASYRQQPGTKGDAYRIGTFVDEWGCEFVNNHAGIMGHVKDPLLRTWDDISKLRVPEELLTVDKEKVNDFCRQTDKFVLAGCCPRPFERLQFLRGTENVMTDLALQRKPCLELLETIHEFNIRELEIWADTDVDGLFFMDDWGGQRTLLISPEMWRKVFKPLYRDYIELVHSRGKKAFMHSDGNIMDILDDFIALGLDAVNSQLFCMNLRQLAGRFKGRITFWGELDRLHLLPHGTTDQIAEAVKTVHQCLYSNGGLIAQLEFGPGAKPENVARAFETWDSLA